MKKKKVESSIEMSIPDTFNGEIVATQSHGVKIAPLTQNFGSEDINSLRDKINEIIEQL